MPTLSAPNSAVVQFNKPGQFVTVDCSSGATALVSWSGPGGTSGRRTVKNISEDVGPFVDGTTATVQALDGSCSYESSASVSGDAISIALTAGLAADILLASDANGNRVKLFTDANGYGSMIFGNRAAPVSLNSIVSPYSGTDDPQIGFYYNSKTNGSKWDTGDFQARFCLEGDYNDGSNRYIELNFDTVNENSTSQRRWQYLKVRRNAAQEMIGDWVFYGFKYALQNYPTGSDSPREHFSVTDAALLTMTPPTGGTAKINLLNSTGTTLAALEGAQLSIGANATLLGGVNLAGLNQQSAAMTAESGNLAGSVMVNDTSSAAGAGGAVIFGFRNGTLKNFAAIKGLAVSGGNLSTGDLVISTRRVSTDATLTESLRVAVSGAVTVAGGFGCNGNAAQTKASVNAAASDLSTVVALCNQLRAALIANGICV